jgi:bifunctional non-homologous end joining protein LigD
LNDRTLRQNSEQLEIDGRRIPVSNLDKPIFPAGPFLKANVIDFYIRIAGCLLPHIKDRPITLKRYPNGVTGKHFYEKNAPKFTPDWVRTFPVPRRGGGPDIQYVVINDLPTLVWVANLASVEIHPFLHRTSNLNQPTAVVFDLDPGEGADVLTCARVALILQGFLNDIRLQSFAKVSGSKGIQVYAPLNTDVTYEETGRFANTVAGTLQREHPDLIVSDMAKSLRRGKVFIDWSQNSDFKTTVAVYSLRAKQDEPFVSMPVEWDELEKAIKQGDRDRLYFGPAAALRRIGRVGDLFAPALKLRQRLPAKLTR